MQNENSRNGSGHDIQLQRSDLPPHLRNIRGQELTWDMSSFAPTHVLPDDAGCCTLVMSAAIN